MLHAAITGYAGYFEGRVGKLLGHKGPARAGAAITRIRAYATEVLPKLVIDRRDSIVLKAHGDRDQ